MSYDDFFSMAAISQAACLSRAQHQYDTAEPAPEVSEDEQNMRDEMQERADDERQDAREFDESCR